MTRFLLKYRNTLLFALLVLTMVVSYCVQQERLAVQTSTVSIPMVQTTAGPTGKLEVCRAQREETALSDIAALQALCDAENIEAQTRADAANRLKSLIDDREKQASLECALAESGLAPCLAVLAPGCVTIVTEQQDISPDARNQVLTLAKLYAGIEPAGVRLICGDGAE